ncbi:MAG: radical SAM protein [Chloroflexi bacterium]|nr:radical SAM protein [Chloroflexota bacterium]
MECPHIPELKHSIFGQRLQQKTTHQRIPLAGSIELTERCNLQCTHCYINQGVGDVRCHTRELTRYEWNDIFRQLADEGCFWLLLTGGEMFVRPDSLDLYAAAKKAGLIITLFTNGTTISPRVADFLAEWPPLAIEVTLYGATEQTYEGVTRVHGSFRRCMEGIERLLDRQLPLKLKAMALTSNWHELPAVQAYADSRGIDFRFDPLVNCRIDGSAAPAKLRLPPEQVVQLDLASEQRMADWRTFCEKFVGTGANNTNANADHLYRCGAGATSFHIDAYGQLSPCLIARHPSYDLRTGSFRQGWYDFLAALRQQKVPSDDPCGRCELLSLCGQCPGWSQLEHGPTESVRPVAYLHEVAHRRAEAFGLTLDKS